MLIFYFVSLFLTILTFNYYIASSIKAGIHRLLPMVIVAIALHHICQMAFLLVGKTKMFVFFDDWLMLEILYLLTHYIREFYYIFFKKRTEFLLALSMVVMAVIVLLQYQYPLLYYATYCVFTNCYLAGLMIAATRILQLTYFSKNERKVVRLLYVALMAAGVVLLTRKIPNVPGGFLTSLIYDGICIGAFYLMYSRSLTDDATLMQMNVFDTSDVAMVLFDPDFYLLEANHVARKSFPEDFEKNRREAQREQFREAMKHFAESRERIAEKEIDGSFYRCTVEDYCIQGKIRGYILTIVDITEEKLQLQRMAQLKQQAEEQNVLKSKFLANMSHDLRSPLHAVMGASDVLLAKNNMTAMNRNYIQMIKNSSKVLLDLVNEILLYSKLEAGKLVLLNNPYSFEGMIKELSQIMMVNLSAKPVEYELIFDTSYPEEVIGDRTRVREVIQNILSNAVKFTEEGKICCKVSCEPEGDKVKITCCISDTGTGMSRAQLAAIFDEYASFSDLRNKEGTGLGMSIVRQLTNLMGGSAKAESDGHSGSTITISFYQGLEKDVWCQPVCYQNKDLIKRKLNVEKVDMPTVAFMDARVLVVDDLEVNLQVFKQIAARWGIVPDIASSGAEAIKMAQGKDYHLIFLDYMMPEMDGMETAAEIKKFCNTPLILLTADASDETKRRCEVVGFADYMCKPIENLQLETNLKKYIPVEYRVAAGIIGGEAVVQTEEALLAQRAILETVVTELKELHKQLPEYLKNDMSLFRIKVHGVKGFTRQINRLNISRQAEIMEMAAKTDNQRFISENLGDFLDEIQETIDEIMEELATLPKREVKQSDEEIDELLEQLKVAFDDFDLMTAERCMEQLLSRELSGEESQLISKCKQACDDIDYDMGSALLDEYLGGH
ncbi:MAG: response regulator [Roseburia sp.]|nr:response regulator [Roseburia sp.]